MVNSENPYKLRSPAFIVRLSVFQLGQTKAQKYNGSGKFKYVEGCVAYRGDAPPAPLEGLSLALH